jgi:RND family efflux transporter MFP subunit
MTDQNQATSEKPEWAKTKSDRRREAGLKPSKAKWLVLFFIVVGVAVAVYALKPAESEIVEAIQDPEISVKYLASQELATVQAKTLQQQIKVTGTIAPLTVAQLPALISAQVDSVTVRPGDAVKKGQLLVSMDTESINIQKEQQLSAIGATQAQLTLAESQLKRTQEMTKQGIAPSSQLEQALSSVQAQEANLQAQKSQIKATDYQLRNANIFSPVNGVVSQRQAEPGQFVGVGSPLMEVVDLSVMELVVNVSTAASSKIIVGMTVNISIEGIPEETFTGTVSRISPLASRGTRTIPVYVLIENAERKLRGGMFAVGQITLNEKANAIAINESAIRYDEANNPYVFKIANDTVEHQAVTLGDYWGENQQVEVISGLVSDDVIVVLPLPGLSSGDAVQMIEG